MTAGEKERGEWGGNRQTDTDRQINRQTGRQRERERATEIRATQSMSYIGFFQDRKQVKYVGKRKIHVNIIGLFK